MDAKILIEENNNKRKMLTKENEAYYDDLLIYIRLQWTLSEQQSEEVLMEMLDHLIEGQKEGKTAKDIFGDDPLSFADEIIEHLPKEKKRNAALFIGGIIANLISWVLIIRGITLLVLSPFIEVNTDINFFVVAVVSLAITCFIIFNIWFIFRITKQTLFTENRNNKKNMIKAGFTSAVSMAIVLLIAKFTPEIGPSVHLSWSLSFILGALMWLVGYSIKKIE